MTNTLQIQLMNARRYSFKDKNTGRLVEGCTIEYIVPESRDNDENSKGIFPKSATLPYKCFDKVTETNSYYDLVYAIGFDTKGKPILKPENLIKIDNDEVIKRENAKRSLNSK